MTPAVVIRLELERRPRVFVDVSTEGEHDRVVDWISAHPRYLHLLGDALDLQDEQDEAAA